MLDFVLAHMDNPNWGIRRFGILQRVAHAFHMEEVWFNIKEELKKLNENPVDDKVKWHSVASITRSQMFSFF